MKRSRAALIVATVTVLLGVMFTAAPVQTQQRGQATGKRWTAPRTPDGQPDIQGRYTHEGFGTGKEDRPAVLCPDQEEPHKLEHVDTQRRAARNGALHGGGPGHHRD